MVEEELATDPADVLFLNDNRHLAKQIAQLSFDFARAEGRVIVTRDQDFLSMSRRVTDHSGIVFYTADQSIREIIEGLILIYEVMLPDDMAGHVEYI